MSLYYELIYYSKSLSFYGFLETKITLNPFLANSNAKHLPIPAVQPVIIAQVLLPYLFIKFFP